MLASMKAGDKTTIPDALYTALLPGLGSWALAKSTRYKPPATAKRATTIHLKAVLFLPLIVAS
jgi:hypothetical protein